uniref:Uncharacterized protein n=1 Tax=Anguilla anguilla TaxID=7936 RepID=A0A0E9PEA3_ANGAN
MYFLFIRLNTTAPESEFCNF